MNGLMRTLCTVVFDAMEEKPTMYHFETGGSLVAESFDHLSDQEQKNFADELADAISEYGRKDPPVLDAEWR